MQKKKQQSFHISLNFLRGFYIVNGFMLAIVGLGSITQSLSLQTEKQYSDIWIGLYKDYHQTGYIINIVLGTLQLILGALAMIGVIYRQRILLVVYNISALVFIVCTLVLSILSYHLNNEIQDTSCKDYSQLKYFDLFENYGLDNFCKEHCKCTIGKNQLAWFNKSTQKRLSDGYDIVETVDYTIPGQIFNATQCPNYNEFLETIGLSIVEGYAIYQKLHSMEMEMKCGAGWCPEQTENKKFNVSNQFYMFSDINRGPPLTYYGCFYQLQKFYENYFVKFASFNIMVTILMVLNCIITAFYYFQNEYGQKDEVFLQRVSRGQSVFYYFKNQ